MLGKLKNFISEAAFYGLANVFSRFFTFFLTPFYIHLLGDKCYANITILQLCFTLASFTFVMNNAVFFYWYDYTKEKVRKLVFPSWTYYQFLTMFLLIIAGLVWRGQILSMIDIKPIPGDGQAIAFRSLIYMMLQFIPFVIVQTYKTYCRIEFKAKIVMWITIGEAVFTVLFIFIFVRLLKMNIDGVMLGQFVGRSMLIPFTLRKGFIDSFDFKLFSYPLMKRLFVFSMPFFLVNIFGGLMSSIDKFVGARLLGSYEYLAYISLAAQTVLPISLFIQMIIMSYAPFVSNIKDKKDSRETYSILFTFVMMTSLIISTLVLASSPILLMTLSYHNVKYYECLKVIPMLVIASVLSLIISQVSLGCTLTKRNIYIAIGYIVGGVTGFILNVVLQPIIGILAAGVSQILSFAIACAIIYYYSHKFYKISYDRKWVSIITGVFVIEFTTFSLASLISSYHFLVFSVIGAVFLALNLYMVERKFHVIDIIKRRYGFGQ